MNNSNMFLDPSKRKTKYQLLKEKMANTKNKIKSNITSFFASNNEEEEDLEYEDAYQEQEDQQNQQKKKQKDQKQQQKTQKYQQEGAGNEEDYENQYEDQDEDLLNDEEEEIEYYIDDDGRMFDVSGREIFCEYNEEEKVYYYYYRTQDKQDSNQGSQKNTNSSVSQQQNSKQQSQKQQNEQLQRKNSQNQQQIQQDSKNLNLSNSQQTQSSTRDTEDVTNIIDLEYFFEGNLEKITFIHQPAFQVEQTAKNQYKLVMEDDANSKKIKFLHKLHQKGDSLQVQIKQLFQVSKKSKQKGSNIFSIFSQKLERYIFMEEGILYVLSKGDKSKNSVQTYITKSSINLNRLYKIHLPEKESQKKVQLIFFNEEFNYKDKFIHKVYELDSVDNKNQFLMAIKSNLQKISMELKISTDSDEQQQTQTQKK